MLRSSASTVRLQLRRHPSPRLQTRPQQLLDERGIRFPFARPHDLAHQKPERRSLCPPGNRPPTSRWRRSRRPRSLDRAASLTCASPSPRRCAFGEPPCSHMRSSRSLAHLRVDRLRFDAARSSSARACGVTRDRRPRRRCSLASRERSPSTKFAHASARCSPHTQRRNTAASARLSISCVACLTSSP